MTDPLEPNDLSHLSDEEFMALCPIGEHAPGHEPLSPAARAVLDAVITENQTGPERFHARAHAAAALCAAADQVVPEMEEPEWGACVDMHCDIELYTDHQRKRSALLALAAELKGGHD